MPTADSLNFLAADPSGISAYWGWIVVGAFVVIGLLLIGRNDVKRFSLKRTWAISGVCFAESIRRKVLWLTPLAMIAVILITQFERALDEQDALRQTVKFCLFATGTVIILTRDGDTAKRTDLRPIDDLTKYIAAAVKAVAGGASATAAKQAADAVVTA